MLLEASRVGVELVRMSAIVIVIVTIVVTVVVVRIVRFLVVPMFARRVMHVR